MDVTVSTISFTHLLESPLKTITLTNDPYYCSIEDCRSVVGSCNGLLCLYGGYSRSGEMWLRFWNPATRIISDRLGHRTIYIEGCQMAFGYDNSTDTYKVVYLHQGARVLSLGDNVWRNIQSFPVSYYLNNGVHLRGSVNWLAIHDYIYSNDDDDEYYDCEYITIEQFKIVSFDLGTETYKELLPPRGFGQVPHIEPSLCVLMDCLCFSHVYEETHFVLWKMTDYGVEDSWTQILKINFQIMEKFASDCFPWVPLHLSKNYDTLLLENRVEALPVVYNLRDGSVERTRITNSKCYLIYTNNYVESLVSCH
jgi:F-box interacting protein